MFPQILGARYWIFSIPSFNVSMPFRTPRPGLKIRTCTLVAGLGCKAKPTARLPLAVECSLESLRSALHLYGSQNRTFLHLNITVTIRNGLIALTYAHRIIAKCSCSTRPTAHCSISYYINYIDIYCIRSYWRKTRHTLALWKI